MQKKLSKNETPGAGGTARGGKGDVAGQGCNGANGQTQGVTARRLALLANGYEPIPLAGKAPWLGGWPQIAITEDVIRGWATREAELNTGARNRLTPFVDIDIKDAEAAAAVEALVRERFGASGRIMVRTGQPPKRAIPFRTDEPFKKVFCDFIAPDGNKHRIEILCEGQQTVVDGIHPDIQQPYTWAGGEPWTVPRAELPAIDETAAREFLDAATELLVARGWQVVGNKNDTTEHDPDYPLIVQLARKLWGEPTRSNIRGEWRFGAHGSKSVDANARTWFDFEADTGGGVKDLIRLVADHGGGTEEVKLTAEPHDFPDETTLALWDFLYGKHLLRQTVAGTAAMGGTGKSAIAIIEALAMASGKALLGEQITRPLRVLLINLEDNRSAMNKRIAAAMKHYGLKREDIGDRLFVKAKGELKLKIAKRSKNGSVERNEALVNGLVDFVVAKQIDVLSVDPLVKTHGINENDSEAMQAVVECYDDIAEAANCAVHLWHHTRKSGGGDVTIESARGAIAFVDACRSVRILETMTKDEAKKLKLNKASFFFREFSGKRNFAPPTDQSTWYQLISVELANGGKLFGDDVGVVTCWAHPGAKEIELTPGTIAQIKRVVGASEWRDDVRAGMWVGKAVAQVVGLDPDQDKAALQRAVAALLAGGALRRMPGKGANRHPAMFVVPGDDASVQQPTQPVAG